MALLGRCLGLLRLWLCAAPSAAALGAPLLEPQTRKVRRFVHPGRPGPGREGFRDTGVSKRSSDLALR